MKNFLLKAFEIFCRIWLVLAWFIGGFVALIFCFLKWLLTPTRPQADPEEQAQEWENWFGTILLFIIVGGGYFWLTLIS